MQVQICRILLLSLAPFSAGNADPAAVGALFEAQTPLEIELEADFSRLSRARDADEAEWHEARLGYVDADAVPQSLAISVRARGRYRLERARCRIPPLWLNFEGRAVNGTLFEGQTRTPLGTHCRESDSYADYTVLEYLSYRAYEIVGTHAIKVRPARITYIDTGSRGREVTRFGFFIEHFDTMADRYGAEVIEEQPFDSADGDPLATAILDVYQFMIGNTDWSQVHQHNIVLLRGADDVVVPVPYDFDWSGLVNAQYATPDPSLDIRNVRQRVYRGVCRPAEAFAPVFELFQQRRAALHALLREQAALSERARQRSLDYLDDFYEVLDSSRKRQREIIDACR